MVSFGGGSLHGRFWSQYCIGILWIQSSLDTCSPPHPPCCAHGHKYKTSLTACFIYWRKIIQGRLLGVLEVSLVFQFHTRSCVAHSEGKINLEFLIFLLPPSACWEWATIPGSGAPALIICLSSFLIFTATIQNFFSFFSKFELSKCIFIPQTDTPCWRTLGRNFFRKLLIYE